MSRRFALLVVLVAIASLFAASPSDAAVKRSGHLSYVSQKATGSDSEVSALAACPPDTTVVGSGGKISRSAPTLTRLHAAGFEAGDARASAHYAFLGADPKPVEFKAYAICADIDAFTLASTAVSGTVFAAGDSIEASCPGNSIRIGGGASMDAPAPLHSSYPSAGENWYAFGSAVLGAGLTVFAVCTSSPNVTVVETGGKTVAAGRRATVIAKCASGGRVAAGGWQNLNEMYVRSSYPWDGKDADTTPDDGWAVEFHNPNGDAFPGGAFAVCHHKVPA